MEQDPPAGERYESTENTELESDSTEEQSESTEDLREPPQDDDASNTSKQRGARGREYLPIDAHRSEILEHVERNRVTFIQGDTGCGKSSMVPQYIWQEDKDSRIMVTQPRRLAAISLANRVGDQLGDRDLVGYRLGQGDRRETFDTKITFCTTGYLLQFLSFNPTSLKGFTHVILDEVHERSMDSDLLLLLLKLLLRLHSHLKLVIMSATLQPQLFSDYFAQFDPELEPLQVGNKRFPVKTVFLDEVAQEYPAVGRSAPYRETVLNEAKENASLTEPMQNVLVRLVAQLAKPGSCILVFLPGVGEIETMQEELWRLHERKKKGIPPLKILSLHSLVPMDEQDRVMQPAGPELCKVVLATNIAESSVTIPDAHFVIDAGLQRGIFLDERTSKPALLCRWVSQASARQRAGRTGRVAPGTVVHLFTRRFHDTELLQHDEAEMSHASLEKTVITTKLLLSKFGSIHDLLAMVITPPTPERIQASLEELCKYGAFTTSTEDAQVTIIGRLAAQLPLELPLIRLILFGHLAGCLPEAIVMASALSQPDLFTMPSRLFIRDTKRFASALSSNFADRMLVDAGQFSEALSCLALYTEWLERRKRVSSISIGRAHSVDITVADICRTLCARGVLKLPDSTAQELIELQSWAKNLHVSGAMGGARRLLLRRNPDVLSFVLGVAAAPNYLKGQVAVEQPVWEMVEQHGLDEKRTVLLRGLPGNVCNPAKLKEIIQYPPAKVDKVVLVGNNDALVQMAPDSDAPESARYTIRDLSFSCKLLLQMYAQGRGKLIITNPRVSGGQTEVPLGGVAYSNPIQWTVVGTDDVVARLNPRSPLASMADLDAGNRGWQPGVAAAFSFLGTQYPKEVYGSAVAMMPSATFGGVVQLIMAQRVRRVRAAVVGGSEASGLGSPVLIDAAGAMTIKSSRRLLISEAELVQQGRIVNVSFEPNMLAQAQWDRINQIRQLFSDVVHKGVDGRLVLEQIAETLVQELEAARPAPRDALELKWFVVTTVPPGTTYLPQLKIGDETEKVEQDRLEVLGARAGGMGTPHWNSLSGILNPPPTLT